MRKTEEYEMIPGNIRKDIMIRKRDLHCYHVYTETRIIDPRQPAFPIIKTRIVVFRPMDYKVYFEGPPANQIGYLKAMNFTNCSLVWDPCAPGAKELAQKVEAERRLAWESAGGKSETAAREAKRKATIGDIERLSK
jgi:hypothetical protein